MSKGALQPTSFDSAGIEAPRRMPGAADQPPKRGCFADWLTQRWVQATGREVTWCEFPWMEGPVGDVEGIGTDFFHRCAARNGWTVVEDDDSRGLLSRLSMIDGPTCRVAEVHPRIVEFYEQTSRFDFDVWSQWCGAFRPFGWALAAMFSRRLQQLNVPLSPLETKLGISSRVVKLVRGDGATAGTAWIRETVASKRALYVGSYSTCRVPAFEGTCLKVAFPLPNGYALVIMKPESHADGSLTVRSSGARFGDPGFYFYVAAEAGRGWARYVGSMKESIHVFCDDYGALRADHDLRLFGATFLRLHYRMRDRLSRV